MPRYPEGLTFQHDFNYGILKETAHRPWPMPAGPWVMTQTWHDLLFAHWRVPAAQLASKIPPQLPLDLFDDHAWMGIVPFHMTNVAPRFMPALPWLSAFPELNVRTYVTLGGKPGVYFFSLDAANTLAVIAARTLFALPYYSASMRVERRNGLIRHMSRRTSPLSPPAEWDAGYGPVGAPFQAAPDTLEYFLTERYCLYTVRRDQVFRLDIHHPPWPLQPAETQIAVNSMADAAGIHLPPSRPLLHFAARQDMVAWPMRRVGSDEQSLSADAVLADARGVSRAP